MYVLYVIDSNQLHGLKLSAFIHFVISNSVWWSQNITFSPLTPFLSYSNVKACLSLFYYQVVFRLNRRSSVISHDFIFSSDSTMFIKMMHTHYKESKKYRKVKKKITYPITQKWVSLAIREYAVGCLSKRVCRWGRWMDGWKGKSEGGREEGKEEVPS